MDGILCRKAWNIRKRYDKYSAEAGCFFIDTFLKIHYTKSSMNRDRKKKKGSQDMFEQYSKDLAELLIPKDTFRPFPKYEDREGWMLMREEYREFLIRKGEEYLGYEWPSVPATVYMGDLQSLNRRNYEKLESY